MKKDDAAKDPGQHEAQIDELLYQALETELGGVQVYRTAIECARDQDLEEEWLKYLGETQNHVRVLTEVLEALGKDVERVTPGRTVVRHLGKSLVSAMDLARASGDPAGAELVACECVVLAETKDHLNWGLIGKLAEALPEKEGSLLREAYEQIEDEEDEHLYHSSGWARELWLASLGLPSVLPPPEEAEDVQSAVEAAEAREESEASR